MDATRPHASQSDPTGRYVFLFPPRKMTAIERRVADVIRHDLHLREDSPPGIYLDAAKEGAGMHIVVKRGKDPESRVPESTTAVDSLFSFVSDSTLGTGGSSDNPLKVAGTTAKFSEPTSRVEDDPPRILGSYAGLTYTNKLIEEMEYSVVKDRAKGGLYRLQITIYFEGHKMAFNLQVDTGANHTWLFHEEVCLLKGIKDDTSPGTDKPCTVTLVAGTKRPNTRAALPNSYMPSSLAKKIDAGTPLGKSFDTVSHFRYPRISYGSGRSQIVVGPMRAPIDFEISNAYNWDTSGSDKQDILKASFSFAICDAATVEVFEDMRIDGLIGFGPAVNMNIFDPPYRHEQDFGNTDYPSFSTALESSLLNVVGEGGIILYWYLNPPDLHNGSSFLAFNKFPEHLLHRGLSWTAPILTSGSTDPKYRAWIVTMKSLKIRLVANEEYKGRRGFEDLELPMKFDDGERFFVDTGSSTTTLPAEAVHILKLEMDYGDPYSVPEWVDLKASTVEYTFASGSEPAQNVVFVTQAHRFICDEHRQGLIWSTGYEAAPTLTRCVLGLNFFHSAIVAMHRPEPVFGEPYFRFAPMAERAIASTTS